MSDSHLQTIRRELRAHVEPAYRDGATRFFKEEVNVLGVRTPTVRKIASKAFPSFRKKTWKEQHELCEELLASGVMEESTIALEWMSRIVKNLDETAFITLERWLKQFVSNWATCDDLCTHVIGPFLVAHPSCAKKVFGWTSSKNRWIRRASAVSLITPVRHRVMLDQIFRTADRLLEDEDDMVRKGYGWMLKVAGDVFFNEAFAYVMAHRDRMPRVSLRYAIEKYPPVAKQRAMMP